MSHQDTHHDDHDGHHVSPLWLYNLIFGGLLCLTVITVWIAQFDFGPANTIIAMLVATVKASLVALFFMHLLHDERLNALTFGFGLLFVCLFFLFPLVVIGTRTYIDPIKDNGSVLKQSKVVKAQEQHAQTYKDKLSNLSNVYNRGFIEGAKDEADAKPVPSSTEGTEVPAAK